MQTSSLNTGRSHIISGAPAVPSKIKNLTVVPTLRYFQRPGRWMKKGVAAWCTAPKDSLVDEVEREMAEEGEEMRVWLEKCGCQGVVELLECLEKEAIMGDDEGKEPSDYSRRARIFDRSSRVFQALQQGEAAASPRTS
ncbi:hypothetical protein SAY86_009969 [Trapa natans]|uniref:Uncharacterized protein n=1 Tax=Trapa natans TaxID=22666 RepID=A0AAN7L0K2_TRANT|nr:hypothetical protein SAY86_009969 [Trapa natans]